MQRVTAVYVLIVGMVLAVDPAGLWPFGPLRWLVVSAGGLSCIAVFLWRPQQRLERRTLGLWAVLLSVLTLSTAVNGDVWIALVGTDTRHFGLLTWLLCFGLFCAGQQLRGHIVSLARACALAAFAVGLWCAWELTFGPPIQLATTTDRLSGPFGSAALLGAAICLLLPPTVALASDRSAHSFWRLLARFAGALCTTAVIGSGSRAAWVGLVVAAAVLAWKAPRSRRPLAIACGVLLLVSVVAMPHIRTVLERSAGASSRVDEWRIATDVLAEHPLLGVGPEGYRIAVSDGVDADYERSYPRDRVLPDRAHSSLLDVSLAGGLIAGLAFAALLVTVLRRSVRQLAATAPSTVGLSAGVVAYFCAQLLLFPVFELDPIAWLLAGAVVSQTAPQSPTRRATQASRPLAAATAAVALVAVMAGLLDVAANRLERDAMVASADGDTASAINLAERATTLRPDSISYRMTAVQVLLAANTLSAIDSAVRNAEEALEWSNHDPVAVDLWATGLLERAIATGSDVDTQAALAAWQVLVQRDPHRGRWQLQLGKAAAAVGDEELARQSWERAKALGQLQATELLAQLQ